jgi:hypothetical protein
MKILATLLALSLSAFGASTYTPGVGGIVPTYTVTSTSTTTNVYAGFNPQVTKEVSARIWAGGSSLANGSVTISAMVWGPDHSYFCAVGGSGAIYTSPDGLNWTARTSANAATLRDVLWVQELKLFIAGNSNGTANKIQTSPDCVTWTTRSHPTVPSIYKVKWVPELGKVFAFSSEGATQALTSTDGINYTLVTLPGGNGKTWTDFAWASDQKKGVLIRSNTQATDTSVWTTTDLSTFVETPHGQGPQNMQGIAYAPEIKTWAIASSGTGTNTNVLTSSDAITWVPRTTSTNGQPFSYIAWFPELGQFYLAPATGDHKYSFDAVTWAGTGDSFAGGIPAVAFSPKLGYVARFFPAATIRSLITKYVGKFVSP